MISVEIEFLDVQKKLINLPKLEWGGVIWAMPKRKHLFLAYFLFSFLIDSLLQVHNALEDSTNQWMWRCFLRWIAIVSFKILAT